MSPAWQRRGVVIRLSFRAISRAAIGVVRQGAVRRAGARPLYGRTLLVPAVIRLDVLGEDLVYCVAVGEGDPVVRAWSCCARRAGSGSAREVLGAAGLCAVDAGSSASSVVKA